MIVGWVKSTGLPIVSARNKVNSRTPQILDYAMHIRIVLKLIQIDLFIYQRWG